MALAQCTLVTAATHLAAPAAAESLQQAMYIPELDALIFLATEFSEEGADQLLLEKGIKALHEAAGQQRI